MAEPGAEPTLRAYLRGTAPTGAGGWPPSPLLGLGISLALSLTASQAVLGHAQLLVQSAGNVGLDSRLAARSPSPRTCRPNCSSSPARRCRAWSAAQARQRPAVSASEVGQTNVIALTAVSPEPGPRRADRQRVRQRLRLLVHARPR